MESFLGQTLLKSSTVKWNRWSNLSKLGTQGDVQLVTTKIYETSASFTAQIKNGNAFTLHKEYNCNLGQTSRPFISMASKFAKERNLLCIYDLRFG